MFGEEEADVARIAADAAGRVGCRRILPADEEVAHGG